MSRSDAKTGASLDSCFVAAGEAIDGPQVVSMFMYDHPLEQTHWVARILLLLVTAAGLPAQVLAGQYVLEKGDGEAVCEQFGKNPRVIWTGCPFPMTEELLDLQVPEWILDFDE